MTLQTILFDLDGTLLDSAPGLMTSTNTALARCGCPPRSLAQITAAMGNGMADLIARSLPGGAEDPRFAACFDAFQEAYQSDMFTGSAPYPGILELLEALGNRGCRLAVVSNKRDGAVKALCRQFFGERIAVAIGERPGVSRKPAPDSALTALQELGCPRRPPPMWATAKWISPRRATRTCPAFPWTGAPGHGKCWRLTGRFRFPTRRRSCCAP